MRKRSETLWKTAFARAADCRIEQQSTARLFGSRSVPDGSGEPSSAKMNSKMNCRSFASGIAMPSRLPLQPWERVMRSRTEALHPIKWDCDASVPPIDPISGERRWRNIRTSSATVPPVQIKHVTQTIDLRVAFSSENGERDIAFNANFRSARMSCPFRGRTSLPPQTWDFAVICAHIGAHAMLHSDT